MRKTSEVSPGINLLKTVRISQLIKKIVERTSAERCLLLRTDNLKNVGDPLRGSVLYDFAVSPLESRLTRFVSIRLDSCYMKLIEDLLQNERVVLITDNMKDCLLKTIYQEDSVKLTHVFKLSLSENSMIYLSVNTTKAAGLSSPGELKYLLKKVEKIRKLLR